VKKPKVVNKVILAAHPVTTSIFSSLATFTFLIFIDIYVIKISDKIKLKKHLVIK